MFMYLIRYLYGTMLLNHKACNHPPLALVLFLAVPMKLYSYRTVFLINKSMYSVNCCTAVLYRKEEHNHLHKNTL